MSNKPTSGNQPSFSRIMAKLIPSKFSLFPHYFIITIIFCFIPSPIHSATLEADTLALRQIKHALDPNSISPSSYINTWDFKFDPCESSGSQFLGILCSLPLDNSSSRVTAIDLDGIGYEGFVTPTIGNLTELTLLNLDMNNFRGPIPDTIANLRKLTRLIMSDNLLTGSVIEGISKLKNLEDLDLSGNKLSGSIPAEISGLRSLNYMSLANNGLSGRIPDLTGLWLLNTLDLSNNHFYGDLPDLPVSLRNLYFSHNIFSGNMTPIVRLKGLKWLDASDNRLSGSFRKEFLTLRRLVHLNVSFNRFTTLEVINYSGEETLLQVLDAQGNHLRGHLPVNLVTFQNLTVINLAKNGFSGSIPKEYGAKLQSSWRRLYLEDNFLTGDLPSEFTHTTTRIKGSLANNCLRCPTNVVLCHGRQRTATQCVGQHNAYDVGHESPALINSGI